MGDRFKVKNNKIMEKVNFAWDLERQIQFGQ